MDAETKISQLFWSYSNRFREIFTFRTFCDGSFKFAENTNKNRELSIANAFFYTDIHDFYFTDKDAALKIIGTPESMAEKFYEHKFLRVKSSIDAASLVFAHAIIDNLVFELCTISSWLCADKWSETVRKQTVSFEDIQNKTRDDIRTSLIDKYMDWLERQSLPTKFDKLLSVCHPTGDLQLTNGQKLDRNRLCSLDSLRHDVAHGNQVTILLPHGDDDIKFLEDMCSLLVLVVCKGCNLKLNPYYMIPKNEI
jgi:hypothetical protein